MTHNASGLDPGCGGDVIRVPLCHLLHHSSGQQLCPISLALAVRQFVVLLELELVPMADLPGAGLPDIHLLCLLYINVEVIYVLEGSRISSMLIAPAGCGSWDLCLCLFLVL